MTDPFVHLHVASGRRMRYGANHPADLVTPRRRARHDGIGADRSRRALRAVKFALACRSARVRPIFGVDLAIAPALDPTLAPPLAHPVGGGTRPGCRRPARTSVWGTGRRVPARGGASVDPRLPRATFLARDGAGWRCCAGSRAPPICAAPAGSR